MNDLTMVSKPSMPLNAKCLVSFTLSLLTKKFLNTTPCKLKRGVTKLWRNGRFPRNFSGVLALEKVRTRSQRLWMECAVKGCGWNASHCWHDFSATGFLRKQFEHLCCGQRSSAVLDPDPCALRCITLESLIWTLKLAKWHFM